MNVDSRGRRGGGGWGGGKNGRLKAYEPGASLQSAKLRERKHGGRIVERISQVM